MVLLVFPSAAIFFLLERPLPIASFYQLIMTTKSMTKG